MHAVDDAAKENFDHLKNVKEKMEREKERIAKALPEKFWFSSPELEKKATAEANALWNATHGEDDQMTERVSTVRYLVYGMFWMIRRTYDCRQAH